MKRLAPLKQRAPHPAVVSQMERLRTSVAGLLRLPEILPDRNGHFG